MSMLNFGKSKDPKLPPVANMPAPTPAPGRNYSPEALKFAQRIIDDEAEIERLKLDSDQWRARALAADEQCRRLEMRLERNQQEADAHLQKVIDRGDREMAKLEAQRQRDVERLTEERDFYKTKFARTVERLHVAGKIVLDALSADTGEREVKAPPQVDLSAIAAELEKPAETETPADAQKSETDQDAQERHTNAGSQTGA